MRNLRLLRSLSLSLLVVGLAASCEQPDPAGGQDPHALILASADTTTEAGSARMSMQMTTKTSQGDFTVDAEGAYDFANQLGEMTMNMTLPEAAGSMSGPQTIEMVFEDFVIYMKYPAISQMSPEAKPWIRMDLETIGKQAGMDLGSLMRSGGSDPSQMLDWLRGVSGDIEVVGTDEVRGASATHYKGSIDLNKVVEEAPAEERDVLKASIDAMVKALGTNTLPFEVWIDEAGRAVRIAQSFEFGQGAAEAASMSMTMDIYDFGVDVEIDIPPASQTSDFEDLMGSMSGSSSSSGSASSSP